MLINALIFELHAGKWRVQAAATEQMGTYHGSMCVWYKEIDERHPCCVVFVVVLHIERAFELLGV